MTKHSTVKLSISCICSTWLSAPCSDCPIWTRDAVEECSNDALRRPLYMGPDERGEYESAIAAERRGRTEDGAEFARLEGL